MSLLERSVRTTQALADAATSTAGAVAGAAAGGVMGAVSGGILGVGQGLRAGTRSVPAAALTVAAIGATGLIDWPVLVAFGGGALILRQLRRGPQESSASPAAITNDVTGTAAATQPTRTGPAKRQPNLAPRSRSRIADAS